MDEIANRKLLDSKIASASMKWIYTEFITN